MMFIGDGYEYVCVAPLYESVSCCLLLSSGGFELVDGKQEEVEWVGTWDETGSQSSTACRNHRVMLHYSRGLPHRARIVQCLDRCISDKAATLQRRMSLLHTTTYGRT